MKKIEVMLDGITAVKDFVKIVNDYKIETDLVVGRYLIDAKSIMGVLSLDLSQPLTVQIHSEDCEELLKRLDRFVVKK